MGDIRALLEVQDLDLEADKLRRQRETLPERAALTASLDRATALDTGHAEMMEKRQALSRSEQQLGAEVSEVAAKAKEVEDTLYSGTLTATKELEAHQEELRLEREKQSALEEQEMEVLEQIESLEAEADENRKTREACDVETAGIREAIAKAEAEIDDALGQLAERRSAPAVNVPAEVLTEYERLRGQEKLRGRAAGELAKGMCGACRMKLPVLEYSRMKGEPEEALITCTHCGRVLVR